MELTAKLRTLNAENLSSFSITAFNFTLNDGSSSRSHSARRARTFLVPRLSPVRRAAARNRRPRARRAVPPRLRLRHRQQSGDAAAIWCCRRYRPDVLGSEYATSRGDHSVAQASATELPFPGEPFDIVSSFDVVYALPDDAEKAAVAEMFRVLKSRGPSGAECRGARGSQGEPLGARRRSAALYQGALRWALERGGFRSRRLTYTNSASCRSSPRPAGCSGFGPQGVVVRNHCAGGPCECGADGGSGRRVGGSEAVDMPLGQLGALLGPETPSAITPNSQLQRLTRFDGLGVPWEFGVGSLELPYLTAKE